MILKTGAKLYHGSYIQVPTPDLALCADGKDFGKGFYVTTDRRQAERFVKSSVGKAAKNGITVDRTAGYVSIFEFSETAGLKVFKFEDADRDWLHCVAAHRRNGVIVGEIEKWQQYDVIAGKIANDNTNQVITAYINGVYGEVGMESADRIAISLLLPQKLTDQICFRTEKGIRALKFLEAYEYRI